MKNLAKTIVFLIVCFVCLSQAVQAQTTTFTYQGKLTDGGMSPTAQYDFQFTIFGSDVGGLPVSGDIIVENVQVTNGIFTVNLDFGTAPLDSPTDNHLEISVRPGASVGAFTTLAPRQRITSSPYSIKSLKANTADSLSAACVICVTDAQISSIDAGKITGVLSYFQGGTGFGGTFLPAGVFLRSNGAGWQASGILASDIPTNLGSYIQNTTTTQATSNFNISGNGTVGGILSGNGSGLTNLNGANLTDGSVTAAQLGNGAVTTDAIRFANVTTDKLADGSVTLPKIAAGAVFKWNVVTANQQAASNNGYLVNSSGEVQIDLPTAPNEGDVVRVSGRGTGGWKIAQNAGQSIIGMNIGLIWASLIPRESHRDWRAVASSADGTKLVAAAGIGQIYTSNDSGVSWTARESNRNWTSVASSADGTKLVAVDLNGQIYTSIDSGVNWTARDSTRAWWAVASSADGTKLVAVVVGGQIYTSTNSGVSWTARESNRNWQAVASSADGTKLVAVVTGGQIYTSINSGVNWTARESNRNWFGVACSADGTKLVAVVTGGEIYTSNDSGVSWMSRENSRSWHAVASSADGAKLVAVVNGGQIYTSTDSGVSWMARESNRIWSSVALSADGTKLVAVVQSGQIYTSSTTTTVGAAGFLTGTQFSAIELQYIGNGQFLPLSHSGAILGF